jgi:hypothetical protein
MMRQLQEAKQPEIPTDEAFSLRAGCHLEESGHLVLVVDGENEYMRGLAAGIQASQRDRGRLAVELVMASSAERAKQFADKMHLALLSAGKGLPRGYYKEASSVQPELPIVSLIMQLEPLPDTGRILPRRPYIAGPTSENVELGPLPERIKPGLLSRRRLLAGAVS